MIEPKGVRRPINNVTQSHFEPTVHFTLEESGLTRLLLFKVSETIAKYDNQLKTRDCATDIFTVPHNCTAGFQSELLCNHVITSQISTTVNTHCVASYQCGSVGNHVCT